MKRATGEQSRREFLRRAAAAGLAAPFFLNGGCAAAQEKRGGKLELIKKNAMTGDCNWCGAREVPADVSWRSVFAGPDEKGEPLIISGTVYLPDGRTPAPDVLIYAYHTDTEGIYGRPGEPQHGRFRGWMLTDRRGRYEIRSIHPAPYPTGRTPAHIHYTLTGRTFREDWIDTVFFEGDRLLTERIRRGMSGKGGFNPIVRLEKKPDGVLYGVRDIRLEKGWA